MRESAHIMYTDAKNQQKREVEMNIKVKIKNQYGIERIYPISHVDTLAALTGQKTLTETTINALRQLGHRIEVEQQKISI